MAHTFCRDIGSHFGHPSHRFQVHAGTPAVQAPDSENRLEDGSEHPPLTTACRELTFSCLSTYHVGPSATFPARGDDRPSSVPTACLEQRRTGFVSAHHDNVRYADLPG